LEELKRKAWACVHPEELPAIRVAWENMIASGSDMELEQRLRRHDGVYEWHLSRVCACKDEQGRVTLFVGSSTNIHDQKLAELAVRLSSDKKDEFLGIATHELRTPITSMKAALQSLERSVLTGFEPDKSISLVSLANKQVNKLTNIVNDLVDVSKIQAGKLRLNKSEFLLSNSFKEVINELEYQYPGYPFEIKINSEIVVNADKIRIDQVILNLLSNAVKYSQPKGVVHIRIEQILDGMRCSVYDEGIGIPIELQPFVFDRFFRVHASSQMFSGLGLGLFISSEIIKQHGGKIGVESTAGKGSCFWFILGS
jgi:two-component system CheB/CheR fusion protein